jgi:photosystem II stability/assembly factor-like uncharacterized protein
MSNIQRDPQGSERRPARHTKYLVFSVVILAAAVVAVVLVSSNSGPRYFSRHHDLRAVAFPDVGHAWAIADVYQAGGFSITGGAIRATTNGGVTWNEQESATTWCSPSNVAFANARCGWVLGSAQPASGALPPSDPNVMLATTDDGATWKRQDTGTSHTGIELSNLACASPQDAWAVGGAGANIGVVLATTDGGATWKRQWQAADGGLENVAFADARHGWAVGDGVILATTDGGSTWKKQGLITRYVLTDVACAGADHAWALGAGDSSNRDVILATSDGGATWKVQYASARMRMAGMAFADTSHGWVVGLGGVILATTDGGTSWRPQRSGTTLDLLDVAFADATHGVAVGDRSKGDDPLAAQFIGSIVLRTTDGGATWTK